MTDLNYGIIEGSLEEIRESVLFIKVDGKVFPIWSNEDLSSFCKGDSLKLKVHVDVSGDFNIKIIADEIERQSV